MNLRCWATKISHQGPHKAYKIRWICLLRLIPQYHNVFICSFSLNQKDSKRDALKWGALSLLRFWRDKNKGCHVRTRKTCIFQTNSEFPKKKAAGKSLLDSFSRCSFLEYKRSSYAHHTAAKLFFVCQLQNCVVLSPSSSSERDYETTKGETRLKDFNLHARVLFDQKDQTKQKNQNA